MYVDRARATERGLDVTELVWVARLGCRGRLREILRDVGNDR